MNFLAGALLLSISGCGPQTGGVEAPSISLQATQVTSVTFDTDSTATWDFVIRASVVNDGNVELTAVSIIDSIVVASPADFEVIATPTLVQGTLETNGSWTGIAPNDDLITSPDTLAIGGALIDFTVRINNDNTLPAPNWSTTIYASGDSPLAATVTDSIVVDLIPTTPPAEVVVGAAKTFDQLVSVSGDHYQATVTIYAESFGATAQAVVIADSLEALIGGNGALVDSVSAISVNSGSFLTPNAAYDGSNLNGKLTLGAAGDSLPGGQTDTLSFIAYVDVNGNTGAFWNQAHINATDATPVGGDYSDNGTNPDPGNDGYPNGGGEDDSSFIAVGSDTICVTTDGEWSTAMVNGANDGKIIQVAPGTYGPASSNSGWALNIRDATIIGSGTLGSVILLATDSHIAPIQVNGNNNRIENIQFEGGQHGLKLNAEFGDGADSTYIYNCNFFDQVDQMIKGGDRFKTDKLQGVTIRQCVLQQRSGYGPDEYMGGVDFHYAFHTRVDSSVFVDLQSPNPADDPSEGAIHLWTDSESTFVEYNQIRNCDRGIQLGLDVSGDPRGHNWAWIRGNNIIHTNTSAPNADVGIVAEHAPNTFLDLNNICMESGLYDYAVESRWPTSEVTVDSCTVVSGATGSARLRQRDGGTIIDTGENTFPDSCGVEPDDPPPPPPTGVLYPSDLTYEGAFLLPTDTQFTFCDGVKAYRTDGDPGGPADGYLGSLYGSGKRGEAAAWEVNIPPPVIGPISSLPRAAILNGPITLAQPNGQWFGMLWLPAQGAQTSPKVYVQHYKRNDISNCGAPGCPKHFWADADLTNSTSEWFGNQVANSDWVNANDYAFEIPAYWAEVHLAVGLGITAGEPAIASGRHVRSQGGNGPALIATAPWKDGNPPAGGSELTAVPLLQYDKQSCDATCRFQIKNGNCRTGGSQQDGVPGYLTDEDWRGGAWLKTADEHAVIFAGVTGDGTGWGWYGFPDGNCCDQDCPGNCLPDCNTCPDSSNKGWHGEHWDPTLVFYDPADFALVAAGSMADHAPQHYARMDLSQYFYNANTPASCFSGDKPKIGGMAHDAANQRLYITESEADPPGDGAFKPVVHVFSYSSTGGTN